MKISGIQKMTLLDYPGKVACTIFLSGCNFRCPFCHNYELATNCGDSEIAPFYDDALMQFLRTRKGVLDGVAITGGEPLAPAGGRNMFSIINLLQQIKSEGFLVKLDTNGYYPDALRNLISQKLVDYIAVDIKNSESKYAKTAGLPEVESKETINRIKKTIDILIHSDIDYEFRTTVMNEFHDDDSIHGIRDLIKGSKKFYFQKFVDRDTVPDHTLTAPSDETLAHWVNIMKEEIPLVEVRG